MTLRWLPMPVVRGLTLAGVLSTILLLPLASGCGGEREGVDDATVTVEEPGGAILDDTGAMIGSATIVEFPDRAALDAWLARDPYVTGGVWQKIEVRPFRVAAPVKG